jgi:hypothetical protein
MRKSKKTSIVCSEPPSIYGDNSNEEYLDIVWGILRVPVECNTCHCKTRTPYPTDGGYECPECFRKATYGY